MDGGGGWCMSRYGSGGGGAQDKNITNRIMLRFRPIAPRPYAGESGGFLSEERKGIIFDKRRKRKYVRVSKNTRSKQKNKTIETLQLLPESEVDRKETQVIEPDSTVGDLSRWFRLNGELNNHGNNGRSDRTAVVVLVVESVTDTCMEERASSLGCTDEERWRNLDVDTCPGFISNGCNNTVEWINNRMKVMMVGRQEGESQAAAAAEEVVRMVVKEEVFPYLTSAAFTCRVRLIRYDTCGKEKVSQILPCDTWRMESGGFAWRLDVKAALCLGPLIQTPVNWD